VTTAATQTRHSGANLLDDSILQQWRTQGYAIVENWLAEAEVARARAALGRLCPGWLESGPEETRKSFDMRFPYGAEELDAITLHPSLISFAERALNTDSVLLAHSVIWCKQAGGDDWAKRGFDQPIHTDYGNNTLVVPDPTDIDQLATIAYYTDVTVDLGPTYVASFEDSEAWQEGGTHYTSDMAPDLLAHERPVTVPAGSILLYTMRTFHRGSAFRDPNGKRVSHHIAFQRADMAWSSRHTPTIESGPKIAGMLTPLSPKQRSVVGFPPPSHPYWTPATVAAVSRRYPNMDMTPYRVEEGVTS
jgi:ectoine hydroxylase-related dioxygenase (phytanoyl-CoA dioxygenase family)